MEKKKRMIYQISCFKKEWKLLLKGFLFLGFILSMLPVLAQNAPSATYG